MLEKIVGIEARYDEINQLLMEVGGDYQRAAELGMERAGTGIFPGAVREAETERSENRNPAASAGFQPRRGRTG